MSIRKFVQKIEESNNKTVSTFGKGVKNLASYVLGSPSIQNIRYHALQDDREYIEKVFYKKIGYKPNLDNPSTLCEKLNWLKLYNRRPEYTMMVDKYEVKKYVENKVGSDYIIPLLGVWDRFEDIDFDLLPDQFVLKCTHDGGPFVCKDKSKINKKKLKSVFDRRLKRDYFLASREWPYKNVKRRIIAEQYEPSLGHRDSIEYKLTVMNGKVVFTTICTGIAHAAFSARNNDHYDRDWNKLDFSVNYKPTPGTIEKPKCVDEMIQVAEKLASGIPYCRVDFYEINGQVKLGEMTFFTWGGFMKFDPPEWDQKLGDWLELPEKYNS